MSTKITVEIDNLTDAQAIALEDMFAEMVRLGNIGSSRLLAFFSDGDGNFRPKIKVDGKNAEKNKVFPENYFWDGYDYKMDYDKIAWEIED